MTAANRDIIIEQGATWEDVLAWATGDPMTPVDLTGYTGRMQIRPSRESAVVIAEIIPTLGGAAGTITCGLTAAQTEALDFEGCPSGFIPSWTTTDGRTASTGGLVAVYDLELTQGATVIRLVQGLVCLSRGVTHD